ncbi:MAG: cytochrome c-type biogenesis protein [Candidatus Villigracilaceae bacterium]
MKRVLILVGILMLALSLFWAAGVTAQGNIPSDDDVNRIAKELYCPVCENTPLDVCPTQACAEWREQIRTMLAEGKTDAEIKQYFVEYYGARVLAEPPRRGFNWLAYIVPPVLIALGALILARTLPGWIKPTITEASARESEPQIESDEYVRQLEDELRKRQ